MTGTITNGSGDVSKSISLTTIGNLAFPLAAFITAPILAWHLGVSGRGELAAATAPLMLLVSVASFGLPESLAYHTARRLLPARVSLSRALGLLWVAGLMAVLGTWYMAPILSNGDAQVAVLIVIAAMALPISLSVAAVRGIAIGNHRWQMVNGEKYLTATVRLVGVVATALTDTLSLPVAVGLMAFSPVVGGLAYCGLKLKESDSAMSSTSKRPTRMLTGYSVQVWIGAMSGVLLMRMDQLLLMPLAGAVQLGIYAVAVNVAELMLVVNNAFRDVMFSADAARRDDHRLHRAARLSLLITGLVALPVGASAHLWFPLIFGEEFREALPVVLVLLIATVVGVPGSIAGSALSARGRPGLRSRSLIVASIVNIIGLVLMVPSIGAMGAAYATLLGNLVSSNLNILWLSNRFGVRASGFYALKLSDFVFLGKTVRKFFRRSQDSETKST